MIKKIRFEISEINILIDSYSPLIKLCEIQEPDLIYLSAVATMLHSFYNGIENIFMIVSKHIDENLPKTYNWHKDLLYKMGIDNNKRNAVLKRDTIQKLEEYLMFRHYFRHSYSFHLNWNKMKHLVFELNDIWFKVKTDLNEFLE